MTFAWIYPWIKAIHVASVLVFVGGVFSIAGFLALSSHRHTEMGAMALIVRRWDRRLTTPAMLATWALGLALGISGGWFSHGWLQVKLALVVVLSGIHGVQSGKLRRLSQGGAAESARWAWLLGACVLGISILAVVKPF